MNDEDGNEKQESEDDQTLNRRVFIQYSAAIASTTSALGAIAFKSDALANQSFRLLSGGDGGMPYPYLP